MIWKLIAIFAGLGDHGEEQEAYAHVFEHQSKIECETMLNDPDYLIEFGESSFGDRTRVLAAFCTTARNIEKVVIRQ
jgi:hypothetical protein